MKIYFFNTLKREKEEFKPVKEGVVGIYSCGPTVYWNQHIGHMYAYIQWDSLVRFLRYVGYKTTWVVNITDVGHMTSDEDWGEDKMEKGAKREGISVWDVANKYTDQFQKSLTLLNINTPDVMPKATKHIEDQIELAKLIEQNGFAYKTTKGLIFDTGKYPEYSKFARLDLTRQITREDVEEDPEKKNSWDFFLWAINNKHIMKWPSPWGEGYPGWHIECTAMSVKYLGKKFDIHTGGIEHIAVHHTNEIAQGYAAFGDQTANYWLHNSWLTFKGEKMSKSLGNIYTIEDLINRGYMPMIFRYLVLTSHYRKGLNFTWSALDSAKAAYEKLLDLARSWKKSSSSHISENKLNKLTSFQKKFFQSISDDLNYAKAISVMWEVAKSNIPDRDKLETVLDFDEVLGLNIDQNSSPLEIPPDVIEKINLREEYKRLKKYQEADEIRSQIEQKGYLLQDDKHGTKVSKA